jgi:hypothetical protein
MEGMHTGYQAWTAALQPKHDRAANTRQQPWPVPNGMLTCNGNKLASGPAPDGHHLGPANVHGENSLDIGGSLDVGVGYCCIP